MTKARDLASRTGLLQVTPTSLSVGSTGSATASTNGTVTVTGGQWIILNGIFSDRFTNYKIIADLTPSVNNDSLYIRGATGGTANTTAVYYWGGQWVYYTGSSSITSGNGGTSLYNGVAFSNSAKNSVITEVANPFPNSATQFHWVSSANTGYFGQAQGIYNNSASFDGVQLYFQSGTITGTVRVYGYNI
jgi:hypothetical protein